MKPDTEASTPTPAVIGVDIGKEVFHVVAFGVDGKIAFRRKIRRLGLKDAFEKLPPCIVGMEEVNDIGEYREQDPALKKRFGYAAAYKATDRFDFPDEHRGPNTAGLRARCGDPRDPQISEDMPAQIPYRIFSDPTSIDVDDEFSRTLNEDDARISGAQSNDQFKRSFLDEIVDDAALDFQRNDFEQEGEDGQHHQRNLVWPAHKT